MRQDHRNIINPAQMVHPARRSDFFVIDKNIPNCLSFLPPSSATLDLWTFVTL